ncbi:MAG: cytochrome P450 [Pseudomonadota bacterium]
MENFKPGLFEDPWKIPLDKIDVSNPDLFEQNAFWPYFERLRKDDPVHYCAESDFGPFWSITKYEDIMHVDTHHKIFSSDGAITLIDPDADFKTTSFIAMDQPRHDVERKSVQGVVSPTNLMSLEPIIRERASKILDELPVGETFNWVQKVSIELTTQMLATLFDFPFEKRYNLTHWSDTATALRIEHGGTMTKEYREKELLECLAAFTELWNERIKWDKPGNDLISMMAHNPDTQNLKPMEFLGNLILLIVGGNDTTRNSISGGVIALNENPEQYQKLRDNLDLIPNMIPEIIRWQTPLTYMRRTALEDTELRGKQIKKGDKVLMWYVSGNRDEDAIESPNEFRIDRANARRHLSFGFGIHRCMGNRMAEMQLRVVWEEIMKRFRMVEIMGEPIRVRSNFVKGISELPVQVHPW